MPPVTSLDVKNTVCSANEVKGASYANDFFSGSSEKALGMISQRDGYGFYSEVFGKEYSGMAKAAAAGEGGGIFDHMALPEDFLKQYYTQVKICQNTENNSYKTYIQSVYLTNGESN